MRCRAEATIFSIHNLDSAGYLYFIPVCNNPPRVALCTTSMSSNHTKRAFLTRGEQAAIRQCRSEGLTLATLAKAYNVSPARIAEVCAGVSKPDTTPVAQSTLGWLIGGD